ncbi:hypothetical protein JJE73_15875 [Comamonas sp. JC664]|nr:hypothetical protein [Comamonas sp. JC664]
MDAGTDAGTDGGFTHIRVMASNLSSGRYQSYDPGHGIRLIKGVDPDIVLMQEFNYGNNSASAVSTLVNEIAPGFYWSRETGAQIPNGVISRWPILESGQWPDPRVSNRDFAWARIDIPGPRKLWVVSVHLLTSSAGNRNAEAQAIVTQVRSQVPETDYLIIGGDLNTDSFSEACFATFRQVVSTAGPHPADHNGSTGTNRNRNKPYDQILADEDIRRFQQPVVIGSSTFPNGLVLDSRTYRPLSEIAPVQSGDSSSENMQHMGVVKDFLVPAF